MRLQFLTAGEDTQRYTSGQSQNKCKINKFSSEFTPVCILPKLSFRYINDGDLNWYARSFDLKKPLTLNYINNVVQKSTAKPDIIKYLDVYKSKYDDYMNASICTEINLYACYSHGMLHMEQFFSNIHSNHSFTTDYFKYYYGGCRLLIGKGSIFWIDSHNKAIPLVILMVKDTYIHDFKVANTLDLDIDTTQLEFWVNDEIEQITRVSPKITSLVNRLVGSLSTDDIKVYVKSNITVSAIGVPIPKLKTVSERLAWLESVKNSYINSALGENLPVTVFKAEVPIIENVTVKFRSRNLNSFIKGNNKGEPKQKKINKFQLV